MPREAACWTAHELCVAGFGLASEFREQCIKEKVLQVPEAMG